ncbi:PstA family ABC transporter permease [Cloacibacillus porcorum]|uniref:PstA family ABC transporter permease n=1 Tax=Cloacibacillus porcorum TaxID=1197717 RepID=UPI003D043010
MKKRLLICGLISCAGAVYVAGACGALIFFLEEKGFPLLGRQLFFGDTPPYEAIMGVRPVWEGIWPAFAGTFCLVLLTMLMAAVPGIGCGIYLARFARGHTKERLSLAVDLLASVPSIVMGLFGFVLILALRHTFAPGATTSISLAAFCLALLVMPSLVVTTRSSMESLPPMLELTGASLGFSENQLLRRLLLPAAARGILGGIILSMGRAAEDTAVIMLTGVVVNSGLPAGLAAKFEALPFLIYYTAAQYADESELLRGFGASMVLLLLSAFLMGVAWLCQRGMERRWKGIY